MENSFYTAISRQQALQAQMDVVANNIANMSTPGYRAMNMVFKEYLSNVPAGNRGPDSTDDSLSMVRDYGLFKNTAPGEMEQTGNALDVAIQGQGWFGVQTPQGTMYTRAGNFQLNADGQLVTGSGLPVASQGGSPITIPAGAKSVQISANGTISTDNGSVGQLMVVQFANEQELQATGNGLYKLGDGAKSAAAPATDARVAQGMLESSNVQPVMEMTRMIEVMRAYQSTQNIIQNEHDRERNMIQQLTRIG